jgi:predicted MFS family arabinose efflux permease
LLTFIPEETRVQITSVGWLADLYGYEIVFLIAGLIALAAVLWLLLFVPEPRQRQQTA